MGMPVLQNRDSPRIPGIGLPVLQRFSKVWCYWARDNGHGDLGVAGIEVNGREGPAFSRIRSTQSSLTSTHMPSSWLVWGRELSGALGWSLTGCRRGALLGSDLLALEEDVSQGE
jgi:hypothetical protein